MLLSASPRKAEVRAEFPIFRVKLGVEEGAPLGDLQGFWVCQDGDGLVAFGSEDSAQQLVVLRVAPFPALHPQTQQRPPGDRSRAVQMADRVAWAGD